MKRFFVGWALAQQRFSRQLGLYLLALIGMTGCMLGPDFHKPNAPRVKGYTAKPLAKNTVSSKTLAGGKQTFQTAQDIPVQWWTVFQSKPLEKLITMALQHNPDIKSANASLKVARENRLAQQATLFPYVQGNFFPTRQLTSGTLASNLANNDYLYSLQTTQLSIAYTPDVFGMNRRQIESFKAYEELMCYEREAVYLTIASNVAFTAIQEASLRAQIKATKRSIHIAQQQLALLQKEQALGQIGSEGVAAQETFLAQVQSGLPPLEIQLIQTRNLLGVLCGRFPSEILREEFTLASFKLPTHLPVSLPSQLLEQRPDIRAAAAQLHVASAQIGVAIANRLPNVDLNLYGGTNPLTLATLFATGTGYWGAGANVVGTLFDAGALLHKQRAAVAAYEVSDAQYRSTVLSAFQNVADTLSAIELDAKTLKISLEAQNAAAKSLYIAKKQFTLGAGNYLAMLSAELAYQQASINLSQSQAARFADSVALFYALGGGWS